MFINDTFYKETDSLIEVLINKFFFKRKIFKVGESIFIELA